MFSGDPLLDSLLRALLVFGGTLGGLHLTLSWAARLGGRRGEHDGWDGR